MPTASKRALDFLVIGAQKAGTTSLFEYLRAHPEVYLPPGKEVPFFGHDTVFASYDGRADVYVADVFARAPEDSLWGTATVSYMAGSLIPEALDESEHPRLLDMPGTETLVPERIRAQMPDVKLIAALRDPIERARSSHQMNVLWGIETRSFEQAVQELLDPAILVRSRRLPARMDSYVVLGEYGRILQGYLQTFPAEQLHVLFTTELAAAPERVVAELFAYLKVDSTFVPGNLGTRYLVGSSKMRVPWLDLYRLQRRVTRNPALRRTWHRLPRGFRTRAFDYYGQAAFQLFSRNRVSERPAGDQSLPTGVREALVDHYASDGLLLEELLGRRPPWLRTVASQEAAS